MLAQFSSISKKWYQWTQRVSNNQPFIDACEADGICMKPALIFYSLLGVDSAEFFKNGIYSFAEYEKKGLYFGYRLAYKELNFNNRVHFCRLEDADEIPRDAFLDGVFGQRGGPNYIAIWVDPRVTFVYNFSIASMRTASIFEDELEQGKMTLARYIEQKAKGAAMEKRKEAEGYKYVTYNRITAEPEFSDYDFSCFSRYQAFIPLESPIAASRIVKEIPENLFQKSPGSTITN
jgi:hypothetical protein